MSGSLAKTATLMLIVATCVENNSGCLSDLGEWQQGAIKSCGQLSAI
jgi:hypothetical protein